MNKSNDDIVLVIIMLSMWVNGKLLKQGIHSMCIHLLSGYPVRALPVFRNHIGPTPKIEDQTQSDLSYCIARNNTGGRWICWFSIKQMETVLKRRLTVDWCCGMISPHAHKHIIQWRIQDFLKGRSSIKIFRCACAPGKNFAMPRPLPVKPRPFTCWFVSGFRVVRTWRMSLSASWGDSWN